MLVQAKVFTTDIMEMSDYGDSVKYLINDANDWLEKSPSVKIMSSHVTASPSEYTLTFIFEVMEDWVGKEREKIKDPRELAVYSVH